MRYQGYRIVEIINNWSIHVRTDTIIKESGTEVSRSSHRHVLQPFVSVYKTKEDNGVMVPDLKDDKLQFFVW